MLEWTIPYLQKVIVWMDGCVVQVDLPTDNMSQKSDHLAADDVIPCTAVHPVSKLEYDLRPLIRDSG